MTICTNCPEIVCANCLCKLFLCGWVVFWVGRVPFMTFAALQSKASLLIFVVFTRFLALTATFWQVNDRRERQELAINQSKTTLFRNPQTGDSRESREWPRYCRKVYWTKMAQNGPNDHFGQNDLIPNWILAFARPAKMDQNGPFLVHLGPPTVLWPFLRIISAFLN